MDSLYNSISDINIDDLEFRGEGNSSLVVAVKNKGCVLRIKKCSDNSSSQTQTVESSTFIQAQIDFNVNVLQRLFRPINWIDVWQSIALNAQDLKKITKIIKPFRKEHRLCKSLPVQNCNALLMPDYCTIVSRNSRLNLTGPIIAVELKPKRGFLSPKTSFSKNFQFKANVCKFALKQHAKKQTGVIQDISSYCPLDLFSGDDVRMRRSLYNLLSSPQNNLQVFQDRKTVYKEFDHLSQLKKVILNLFPQSQNLMETFVDLLCQALLHSFPVLNKQTNDSTTIESSGICDFHKESSNNDTIQTETKPINVNSVLGMVLKIQKLDQFDSEIAQKHKLELERSFPQQFKEWKTRFDNRNEWIEETDFTPERACELIKLLNSYLYSLIACDCSIMIAIQSCRCGDMTNEIQMALYANRCCILKSDSGEEFMVRVSLVDLDKKDTDHLENNLRNDCKWIQQFVKHNPTWLDNV